ncbi:MULTISPECIES: SAF domain-containing protein [Gammaproteobacteria]|uniref:SAF domain-containing protein n=1 Tax=Gammaproteobacteria TaxID=1236 RepID=UPI000DD0CDF7|nr:MULTISPECIES: SAF domain-containing protein [Gammaproteobacteria]RTE87405.1 hypothetical protein DQX04_03190 [Aliidiomarina sp. B3213]TCZ92809.1 hypothetical protein EYQ95_02115 [Lysobacter sp. N42]
MSKKKLLVNLFIPLILAVVFSVVAFAMMRLEVERQVNARPRLPPLPVDKRAVLVPVRDLDVGEVVSNENLAVRRLAVEALPVDTLVIGSLENVTGYKTKVAVFAGKPLQRIHLQEGDNGFVEHLEENYYPFTVEAEPVWTHDRAFQLGDSVSIYQRKVNLWELLVSQAPIIRLSPLHVGQSEQEYDYVTFGVPQRQYALLNELNHRSELKFVISNGQSEPILRSFTEPSLFGVAYGAR